MTTFADLTTIIPLPADNAASRMWGLLDLLVWEATADDDGDDWDRRSDWT